MKRFELSEEEIGDFLLNQDPIGLIKLAIRRAMSAIGQDREVCSIENHLTMGHHMIYSFELTNKGELNQ